MLSPLGEAALAYIREYGWKVYPLKPGTKIPLSINHTYKQASNNPEQIRKWWTEYPDANIAMRPGDNGIVVIDLDGLAADRKDEFPATFTVQTPGVAKPSPGYHLYYKGQGATTQGVLGEYIDTLGEKGQVVLPPSKIGEREYVVLDKRPIQDLPTGIADRIKPSVRAGIQEAHVTLDLPIAVAAARNLLNVRRSQADGIAISGRHGNNQTYRLAARLFDLGLSRDKVFELMDQEWNPWCCPPWSRTELFTIVDSASRNRQNPIGCNAVKPTFITGEQLLALPSPEPLVPKLLQRNENILFFGPPKSGKTYILLDIALSLASGTPIFGTLQHNVKQPTVYLSGEGHGGIKARLLAWSRARNVSLIDVPFFYHIGVPQAANFKTQAEEYIVKIKTEVPDTPALIVIDTMARAMAGLDENSASAIGQYLELTEIVRRAFPGCTVASIGHSGHQNSFRPRGSSNILAGLDGIWQVETNPRKQIRIIPTLMKDNEGLPRYCFQFTRNEYGSFLEPISEVTYIGPYEYLRHNDMSLIQ